MKKEETPKPLIFIINLFQIITIIIVIIANYYVWKGGCELRQQLKENRKVISEMPSNQRR